MTDHADDRGAHAATGNGSSANGEPPRDPAITAALDDAMQPPAPHDRARPIPHRKADGLRSVARSTLDAARYLARLGDAARMQRFLDRHTPAERDAILQHLSAWRRAHVE
jgi:hypothetical protein